MYLVYWLACLVGPGRENALSAPPLVPSVLPTLNAQGQHDLDVEELGIKQACMTGIALLWPCRVSDHPVERLPFQLVATAAVPQNP